MSLDWDITDVKNWEELTESEDEKQITQTLVFHSVPVGISPITEKNWKEFYIRVAVWEKAFGATLRKHNIEAPEGERFEERPIRPNDVRRRIGLRTNVSKVTKDQFNAMVTNALRRDIEWELRQDQIDSDVRT